MNIGYNDILNMTPHDYIDMLDRVKLLQDRHTAKKLEGRLIDEIPRVG